MPGTPATTPNLGLPRYANTDPCDFAADVNAISDKLDDLIDQRGHTSISGSQSTTSASYVTLATPDQVTGIVLPTNGLIRVRYWATWQESVADAARAAIFIGSDQLKVLGSTSQVTEAAATGSNGPTNTNYVVHSAPIGLVGSLGIGGGAYTGDVTTGQAAASVLGGTSGSWAELNGSVLQVAGIVNAISGYVTTPIGGPCDIDNLPAGTYTISVRFKTSSGSVTVANRRLRVEAIPFA